MIVSVPLSEGEKKWQLHFERKLDELEGADSFSTAFLDPRQLELAETILSRKKHLSYTVFGGYPGAERNALCVFPAQHKEKLPLLKAVKVDWSGKDLEPGHRDLLGAILGLGLRRDQLGDIIFFEEGGAAIFLFASKADFVATNLLQVGSIPVKCDLYVPDQLPLAKDDGKDIKGTVASLRLDALLSLGFGISRSRVVLLVKGGVARVNWRTVTSPAEKLKEGDQISLKGKGRILITAVEGQTRKGRFHVRLKKYH